jgi:hypothetical protein
MMGELPTPGFTTSALENFLPEIPVTYPLKNQLEKEVLDLLAKGRNQESRYDIKNSPVATFIIKSIGFGEIDHVLKKAKDFFAGNLNSEEFLSYCNPHVVMTIANGVKKLFDSRSIALGRVKLTEKVTS